MAPQLTPIVSNLDGSEPIPYIRNVHGSSASTDVLVETCELLASPPTHDST